MTNTITTNRADQIIDLHDRAISAAKTTVEAAIEIGRLLTEQKSEVSHGGWIPWVEANLPFDRRQASNYMRVFQCRHLLTPANGKSISHLTAAVAQITEKKVQKEIITAEVVYAEISDVADAHLESTTEPNQERGKGTYFIDVTETDGDPQEREAAPQPTTSQAEPIEAELLPADDEPMGRVVSAHADVVDDVDDGKFGTVENFWDCFNDDFAGTRYGRNGKLIPSSFEYRLTQIEDSIDELLEYIEGAEEEGFTDAAAKARGMLGERLAKLTGIIDRVRGSR